MIIKTAQIAIPKTAKRNFVTYNAEIIRPPACLFDFILLTLGARITRILPRPSKNNAIANATANANRNGYGVCMVTKKIKTK